MPILNLGIWIIIGKFLLILLVPDRLVRSGSLFLSIFIFYIVLIWWYLMPCINYEIFLFDVQAILSNNLIIFLDSISVFYCLLLAVVLPLAVLSGWYLKSINSNLYFLIIIGIGIMLLLNFLAFDLMSFYIFFESSLVPLFVLINLFGSTNRTKASFFVLLFTLFGSLFMLVAIVIVSLVFKSTSYFVFNNLILSIDLQLIMWLLFFFAILIKSPLFPFHTWLPLVHSESPLGGSILLASLILKLTVYLIFRWVLPTLPEACIMFSPLVFLIALMSIVYVSFVTLVQIDLKVIIAYSSVAHMAIAIIGIFSNNLFGLHGAFILSLAHGFISSGLFIAVGGILYDRFHTRIIIYFNGLLSFMPLFSLLFLVFSFANIATPLSANFLGEFLCLLGAFKASPWLAALCAMSVILSSAYQFKLSSRITAGVNCYIANVGDLSKRECFLLVALLVPSLVIGILPNAIIRLVPMVDYIY